MLRFLFVLIILFSSTYLTLAGSIEKGFEALKIYNYFEAKKQFQKALKKNTTPASYGLSIIHLRTDNPFHNLDSAYKYIQLAEKTYELQSEKLKERFKKVGIDYLVIIEQSREVSKAFYNLALNENTEKSFARFVENHPHANEKFIAIQKRDSCAFETAVFLNLSDAFQDFMNKYPDSYLKEKAAYQFQLKQYQENTADGTVNTLYNFTLKHPSNLFVGSAEDRMFEILTKSNQIKDYEAFISQFPTNRNVAKAWRNLYQLYMYDYAENRIESFKSEYPGYPFMDDLEKDMELARTVLVPFKSKGKFGLMNHKGEIIYEPQYENVGFFSEGLAYATKDGQTGYIDKSNKVIIPFSYDSAGEFEGGRAVVKKNDKYGIIDRKGELLFNTVFEDIGQFSDGLVYASKNDKYGYFDKFGNEIVPCKFEEAFSFVNGVALVKLDEKTGLIDQLGQEKIPLKFEDLYPFSSDLFVFEKNEKMGVISTSNVILVDTLFDKISPIQNGLSIVERDGKMGYLNEKAEQIIAPIFDTYPACNKQSVFVNGFAKVKKDGKFGVINSAGTFVIPASYENLGSPSEQIAFLKGSKWGFINQKNKIIIPAMFDDAQSFENQLAIVETLGKKGVINTKGEWVIPANYDEVRSINGLFFMAYTGVNWGIYKSNGQQVVPENYTQIRLFQKEYLILSNEEDVHYFYLPQELYIMPRF